MGGEKVLLQILLFSIPCIFLFIKVTHIKKPVRDILLIAILVLISVCSTKPLPKSRTTLDTRGERLRCFEFDEMDGI